MVVVVWLGWEDFRCHSPRFSTGTTGRSRVSVSANWADSSVAATSVFALRPVTFFSSLTTNWRRRSAPTPRTTHVLNFCRKEWKILQFLVVILSWTSMESQKVYATTHIEAPVVCMHPNWIKKCDKKSPTSYDARIDSRMADSSSFVRGTKAFQSAFVQTRTRAF